MRVFTGFLPRRHDDTKVMEGGAGEGWGMGGVVDFWRFSVVFPPPTAGVGIFVWLLLYVVIYLVVLWGFWVWRWGRRWGVGRGLRGRGGRGVR